MNSIVFSHYFEKLGFIGGDVGRSKHGNGFVILLWFMRTGPDTAQLVAVSQPKVAEIPKEFIDYETKYVKHPKSKVLNLPQLFPMIRRFTLAVMNDYVGKIGVEFRVEIDELFE